MVITVIVVVTLMVVASVSLSWQSVLAAFVVEVNAAWFLAVLPTPHMPRLRVRS